jgi:hypothetical protein
MRMCSMAVMAGPPQCRRLKPSGQETMPHESGLQLNGQSVSRFQVALFCSPAALALGGRVMNKMLRV